MAQLHDEGVRIIKQKLSQGEEKYKCFQQDHKGVLWFESFLIVLKNYELRKQILDEAHLSKFSIHSGSSKIYQDHLRQNFLWTRMKREIAKYVSECDTCQRIKASHLKLLVPCNLCLYHPRNGRTSIWISLLAWQIHLRNMIQSG